MLHIVRYFYTFARISGHVTLNPVCNKGSIWNWLNISYKLENLVWTTNCVQGGEFFEGLAKDEEVLKINCPHIVVGIPGMILALIRSKKLPLKNLNISSWTSATRCWSSLVCIIYTKWWFPRALSFHVGFNDLGGNKCSKSNEGSLSQTDFAWI